MDKYVPTTEEVCATWADAPEQLPGDHQHGEVAQFAAREQAFYRWLAQVKAEALREAAAALETATVHWSNDGEDTRAAWLRRRANRIEEGS